MAHQSVVLFLFFLLFCSILVDSKSVKKGKGSKNNNPTTGHDNSQENAHESEETNPPRAHGGGKENQAKHEDESDDDQDNHDSNEIKSRKRGFHGNVVMLGKHPSCADDIERLCHEVQPDNNFALLVCLQDKAKEDDVSKECHNLLWSYKKNLTCDVRFEDAAKKFCKDDLKKLPYCKQQLDKYPGGGKFIPCMLMHRQVNITDPQCHSMMTKMQAIVFSNYHLIDGFFNKCHNDVVNFGCGRITNTDQEEEDIHDQNSVLECLEDHTEQLTGECQKEIYRMAELSADDYHMDRPLYYACRDDREKFCAEVPAGEGAVYKCLEKNKFDERMSKECQAALTVRQKVVAQDHKADYGLLKSCEADYQTYKEEYKCGTGKSPHGSLANVLLCLEHALNDGKPVDSKCQSEMFEIRQQLMDDYKINPEVVASCEDEIAKHCAQGKERQGKTLDCLMKLAEEGGTKISQKCIKAVSTLLRETGAGGDYRIDQTLYRACEPVVHTACKDKGNKQGDVMVLTCLMDNLNSDNMIPECREQLLHLQFFIARDFRLDPAIFKACKQDAKDVCHAPSFSEESESDVPSGMIVSCLYRNSFSGGKVSANCGQFVRRAMHQRAVDVHLIPEVQESCMKDLGQHCSQNIEKGQEMECLQTNLEKLTDKCKAVIRNFTEQEGQDYQLDPVLVRMCTGMVTKFCEDVVNRGDSEGVLPCLIEHKNDAEMDEKCRASVHHWQLIEMQDFTFSSKFKKACRKDVQDLCPKVKTKYDVVKCLSTKVRNAIVEEKHHVVSEKCRKELRIAEKEEEENINFDPELFGVCKTDAQKYCSDVEAGQAKVLECLKENFESLTKQCQESLFEKEKEEMQNPEIDFQLVKACQRAIKHFCSEEDPRDILKCLKANKHDQEMDQQCRAMITKRQKTQYENDELDPELHASCKKDMRKFCKNKSGRNMGEMVTCLKKNFDRLTEDCETYIRSVTREEALDYRLDPTLSKNCHTEISKLCQDVEPGKGRVEQCLRNKFGQIEPKSRCFGEVIRTLREGKSDIYVDVALYDACHLDVVKHCSDVLPGKGRVTNCLVELKKSKKHGLSKDCNHELTLRLHQWGVAKVAPPESLSDIAFAISSSPSKSYFFMVFAIALAIIFLGGLLFGRFSKRVRREIKDR